VLLKVAVFIETLSITPSFADCTPKQNGVLSTKENTAFRFNMQVQAKTT
jgi:hypothetical protein